MRLAYNLTRRETHYRHEAFSVGLKAAGFEVRSGVPHEINPGDVLLIWNRYGQMHDIATRFEKAGGIVLVAENGYLGRDEQGGQLYALAIHAHNGRGTWPVGAGHARERFDALNIELKPWRMTGEHILVCPNRSFGMPGNIMPCDWAADVKKRLQQLSSREIRVRPHPGNNVPKKPLGADLANAWAVVIWGSSAGVHALVAGIPVICESPYWICKEAAQLGVANIIDPLNIDFTRTDAMSRLVWAQWSLAEIESGAAFDHLLRAA